MTGGVRLLCALSVLCGLALSLAPEGGVKRMMGLCSAVLMLLSIFGLLREVDLSVYAVEISRYRELGRELSVQGEESRERLNRAVIESECEQYILHRAASLGLASLEVSVTAHWDPVGCWVPVSVELAGDADGQIRERLTEWIEADLGIGRDRQSWRNDGA